MSEDKDSTLSGISKASTLEEIAEFWDTHSLADYWDETHEVAFEVRVNVKTEDAERRFWATHDSTEYVDWDKANLAIFPYLEPTTKAKVLGEKSKE
ncbi:MAG TPA: CopG family antitoxin [Anaerolineae bacterium]|nr:CopG family antitoxin [Anaerolineae bacterium]HQI86175.1 CopG family antitoxin [Anaerolineae bacterium]